MHSLLESAARCRERLVRETPLGRLLQPRCVAGRGTAAGVILLKIDGLSRRQFERALRHRRLPYLKRLLEEGGHTLKTFYSGMPSTTPVVQAELFFGVKTSLPAITFYDRRHRRKHNLLMPASAETLAGKLTRQGRPLLEGGRAYADIYTGGAEEARYCIQTMQLRSLAQIASSVKLGAIFLLQPFKLLQMLGYGLLEAALALTDFFGGVVAGKNLFKELKFVPTRVLVSIILRELIRTRVKMDVTRGVPIVHASFLGYDEQAHRRGPGSAFAHWSLKGIDDAIREIHRAARNSPCRGYRLVVYADHGQEAALPYAEHAGRGLEDAVAKAVRRADEGDGPHHDRADDSVGGVLARRARGLFGQTHPRDDGQPAALRAHGEMHITALGPLGHVYLPEPPGDDVKGSIARNLVEEGGIPLVLYVADDNVAAVNARGRFDLETEAAAVLGAAHPLGQRAARDLAAACRHPQAGDLVISGWSPEGPPLTFAVENGSHGGPGREETQAFALLPEEMAPEADILRPLDLRRQVLAVLEAENEPREGAENRRQPSTSS